MSIDETRVISLKVERFNVVLKLPSEEISTEFHFETQLEPVTDLSHDTEVILVSSGFDIKGLSTVKAKTPYPISFKWTISPKKEGIHELLIDLSQIIRDSRFDSRSIGNTDVRVGVQKLDLSDGVALPLKITVTGQFGVPSWLISTGASLPGLFGFFLTYPLFVEWLKKKRTPKPSMLWKDRRRRRDGPKS